MRLTSGGMMVRRAIRFMLAAAAAAAPVALPAQEAAPGPEAAGWADPTRAGEPMRDALKAQLVRFRSIRLKGLVAGGESGGVALLEMGEQSPILVTSNSQFTASVAGLPLRISVRNVSAAGVELEAPTLTEALAIPGSFPPSRGGRAADPRALRHIEFNEVPLTDALRMLAGQCGTNFAASAEAGRLPVSLFLSDVSARSAVEELCKSHGLWYREDDQTGILRIMTLKEFERDLVSFHDEQTEVFTLLYPNVLEVAEVIRSLYGDQVCLSLGRDGDNDQSQDLASRFERFDMINQRSQGLGTLQGVTGAGAGIGTTVMAGDSGAIWSSGQDGRTFPEAVQSGNRFRELTPELARQAQRAQAPGVSSNDASQALDALREKPASIFLTVSRRNNMIILRTSDTRAMADIRTLVRRMDVPTSMVLLEIKILNLDIGDDFTSIFDYQFNKLVKVGGGEAQATAGFQQGDIQPPAAGSMLPGGEGLRSDYMTFQIVNEYFKARMQVLESKKRVTVLASPLLLTANNEVSRLFLGEERPLVRNITGQTIITENSTAVTPSTSIEFRPVGTTVLITPNINSDRTVTLRLLQEESSIKSGAASIPIVVSSGSVQNVSIDVVASRSISGTFVAKDDMAVAIGGLISETISNKREQVPILGNIPFIGILFRREARSKTRQELVVMIRPHVISTPAEGEGISRKLMSGLSVHPAVPGFKPSLETFEEHKPAAEGSLLK